ncbi:MAG: DUF4175 domain-containing protein [Actinobacteria bacterium]|jgi:hypothetical protein|nr:DUF4175 domain-containing protein [Actinomycetota bacterium]
MSRSRSILLLVFMGAPALLAGWWLDSQGDPLTWWVWSLLLVLYFAVVLALWWWITRPRSDSHDGVAP